MNYRKTNLTDMKKIGSKIKQVRTTETELTQQKLAEKCGLSVKAISEIESGIKNTIMGNTLDSICKALDTRIENIIY